MKNITNLFEVVCDNKVDASIMQIKSNLLVLLMSQLNKKASKRKDMAKILGCSEGEMSRIANGYLSSISIEKIIKHLASVDCLSFSEFSDGTVSFISREEKLK